MANRPDGDIALDTGAGHGIGRDIDGALAHEGPNRYAAPFELLYREASRPNEMWQADHTPLDSRVYDERGRPA